MTDLFTHSQSAEYLNDARQDDSPIDQNIADLYEIVHEGKKHRFLCKMPDCTKSFRFKSEIERHISAHSEHRPHTCTYPECQRAFKRLDALENHVRSQHTGEASLFCSHPDCGKNFTTNAKLRYHMLLHLDEKPYKCSLPGCERSFVTLSQLKQHENSSSVHKKVGSKESTKKKEKVKDQERSESKAAYEPDYEEDQVHSNKKDKVQKIDYTSKPIIEEAQELALPDPAIGFINPFEHVLPDPMSLNPVQNSLFEGKHVLNHVLSENEVLKNKLEQTTTLLNVIKSQMNQFANFRPEEIAQIMMPKSVNTHAPFKSLESKGAFHFHQKPTLENVLWDGNGMRDQLFGSHFKDIDIHLENYYDKAGDLFTSYTANNNLEENPFMHFD